MDDLTPAEKTRAAKTYYERERRKRSPAVRESAKKAQERYWSKFYDTVLKPQLDAKIYGKKENET